MLQGTALHPKSVSALSDMPGALPALFAIVTGCVPRAALAAQAGGANSFVSAFAAEALLGSEMLQSVTAALANLAHYPEVSAMRALIQAIT